MSNWDVRNMDGFRQGWKGGLPETPCGSGSKLSETEIQRRWIPEMVSLYGITDIADLGAGDLNWAAHTAFGCGYTPYDLIPRTEGVERLDILTDNLPKSDCYMVLWVINHMTAEQARFATGKIMDSGARYIFATWRSDFCNFPSEDVVESVKICNGAEIRLIEL